MSKLEKVTFVSGARNDKHAAEVLETLPKGYNFWLMTSVVEKGYALLVPATKDFTVDTTKVKAVEVEQTKEWDDALGVLASFKTDNLVKSVESYIKRHSDAKTVETRYRVQVLRAVLPQLKNIPGA